MTKLAALVCPACQAPLAVDDARLAEVRVVLCAGCATGVDLAVSGLAKYAVVCAPDAGDASARGLYWSLTGTARIVTFAASAPAVTALGTVTAAGDTLPFTLDIPADATAFDAYDRARARVGKRFTPGAWSTSTSAGTLGRDEAERIAHQVVVTLVTAAPGNLQKLELALDVTACSLLVVTGGAS